MLGSGLIDGDIITGILIRTFAYTLETYAVDHYAAARPGYGNVAFAGAGASGRARAASQELLAILANNPGESVLVRHSPRILPGALTRVAFRTLDGAVVVVALKGYVEDAVARTLAQIIADSLWRDRFRLRRPVAARAFDPSNIDGLGTPLPSYTAMGRLLHRRP